MTTSTRAVPLLVPDSDSGVRCPSDVFTGDAELSILEASKILGYSEGGLMKAIREERVDLVPHQARGGLRIWRSDLDVVIADMTRRAARHGSYCPLSTPSFGYVEDCQCVACHCGDDHQPGGFLGTCQRCGRPRVVDGKVVR